MTMGLKEVGAGDAVTYMAALEDTMQDLGQAVLDPSTNLDSIVQRLYVSIMHTMSDQAAVNGPLIKLISDLRVKYLPLVIDRFGELSPETKGKMSTISSFACRMHILVNFGTDACKILKVFENNLVENNCVNPFSFGDSEECGSSRLVRTAAKAFTEKGSDKAGVASHFNTFLKSRGKKNHLKTFRGHRVNMVFEDSAAAFYHLDDMKEFLELWNDPNRLLQSVAFDVNQKSYVAGIRAMGILYKVVMEPFWALLMKEGSIMQLNKPLLEMQQAMEKWAEDGSTILVDRNCFSESPVIEDCLYEALLEDVDAELDSFTIMALELLCGQLLIVLERQAKTQLPGGKFWDIPEEFAASVSHVPKTNICSERDMAMIDFLLKTKPAVQPLSLETYVMWLQNKPSSWLQSLSVEEKEQTLNAARVAAPSIKATFIKRKDALMEKKKEQLEVRQRKKVDKEEKIATGKLEVSRKITQYGGPWLAGEIDAKLEELNTSEQVNALHIQLKFHQAVLQSKGQRELFQKTSKGKNFTVQQLRDNLLQVLKDNPTADIVSRTNNDLQFKATADMNDHHSTQKRILGEKLREARLKRQAHQQKEQLPEYIKNPQSLVGKHVLHCCRESGENQSSWFGATVTGLWQIKRDTVKTEYKILYDESSDDEWHMPLLCDLEKGDLIIQ